MDIAHVTFRDKMLPSQLLQRTQFEGDEQHFHTVLYEALMRFNGLKRLEEEFQFNSSYQMSTELMASCPFLLRFLQVLIVLKQPRRVLEIGTFLGLSTLYMACALPEDGRIVTVEKHAHFAELARENFLKNGLDHKIQLIRGDAFEVLQHFDARQGFDMVFLDGNKERYAEYFSLLDPLLLPQGLLVVDDALFLGDVLNARPKTAKGLGVKMFLEAVETRTDYQKALLPIGNGMMLLVKQA